MSFAAVAALFTASRGFAGNEKVGTPGAVGGFNALPYLIRFENPSSSTAPVQQVVVVDPLDVTKVDPQTVALDAIVFGNIRVVPPPGLRSYATQVDLRPNRNLLVNVAASVDLFTGVVSWYLTSIDPETNQPPADPLVGFLPPNIVPPEGEGSVLFTVLPLADLPSGTVVSNRASLAFDENPPVSTNVWQNTIDKTPPASHVLPLAQFSDQSPILVQWEAEASPDIESFTLFVSEDGSPYRVWRLNTTATSDTLVPSGNHVIHELSFYSVARDEAGNVEAPPSGPDATTLSRTAVDRPKSLTLELEGAVPNPTRGSFGVQFTLPTSEPAVLEIVDIAGRRVMRREVSGLGPGRHRVFLSTSSPLQAGIYMVRLSNGGATLTARAAVIE